MNIIGESFLVSLFVFIVLLICIIQPLYAVAGAVLIAGERIHNALKAQKEATDGRDS